MENRDLLKELQEPMPYKWKVQTANEYGANCVAYIDARDVQDRLDEVFGVGGWQNKYELIDGVLFCSIGVVVNGSWIWKTDCGTESTTEKEKGEASDAFKRAAVHLGIGRFLYSLPIAKIPKDRMAKNNRGKFVPMSKEGYPLNKEQLNQLCDHLTKAK